MITDANMGGDLALGLGDPKNLYPEFFNFSSKISE